MKRIHFKNPFLAALLMFAVSTFSASSFSANPNAPVKIADSPVFVDIKSLVPTNVLLLADDSGSMTWTHAPEGIGDVERACWRGADGTVGGVFLCSPSDRQCKTIDVCGYPYPNPYRSTNPAEVREKAVQLLPPPLMAAGFNKMAYHPEVTYLPPVFENQSGNTISFPSMKDASNGWTKVGWPESFGGIARPQGVPVTINMRDVTKDFPQERTYFPDQRFSLQLRYMNGASASQLAQLTDIMPMHYFKTSVKWCRYYQSVSPTPDGNPVTPSAFYEGTLYLGSASPQDCQDDRTAVYKYPYYYFPNGKYTSPNKEDHTQYPSFELVVLDYSKGTGEPVKHTVVDENGVLQTKSRTYEEELENYANWYAYYGNRTAATRTVATFALAGIEPDRWLRMSVATVNSVAGNTSIEPLTEVKEFDPDTVGGKYRIYKALLEHEVNAIANKGTPLKTAMHRVRAKFDADKNLILHSCQRNYLVALTDGLWNDDSFSGVGNQDLKVVSTPPRAANVLGVDLANNTLWPRPIREGAQAASDTLSDISLYAWLNELRKDFTTFDVDQTANDPAGWKHLNTLALTYAGEGTLSARNPKQTLARIASGAVDWPTPRKNEPTAIDDLWHATVSGFGVFTTGVAPHDFDKAIDTGHGGMAGLDVISRGGTFAELGLPISKDLGRENEMFGYSASFTPNWGGTVQKRRIHHATEIVPGAMVWDAAVKLAEKMGVNNEPWNTERKIFTAKGNGGIPFTFSALSSAAPEYLLTLGANQNDQKEVVNYLRGDRRLEESLVGGKYRKRPSLLGDFVHASPAVVDKPGFLYNEFKNPGYGDFKKAHEDRKRMIYAAGNDGMLHAFDDDGNERWAFIPPELFRSAANKGIVNLLRSREEGWAHYFYVDATPRVIDVDIGGDRWRTLLIGGMGKGGTSYYALDVTEGDNTPAGQGEALFQWTFTDDNMGYAYGRALMVKTKAWGGRWVAILPSGLNNGEGGDQPKKGDGKGRIFFVDLATGKKIHEVITNAGTKAEPSGLAYIRAFVESSENQLADAVYGGDQLGNFWRFDLTSENPDEWKAVKLMALRNKADTPLPVNTEPRIEVIYSDSEKARWIMAGTGRFYDEADLYDGIGKSYPETIQGMFAFKDGTRDAPEPDTSSFPYHLSDLKDVSDGLENVSSDKKGWVHFFDQGYQVITNPDSLLERTAYIANRYVPSGTAGLDICATSPFEAMLYERQVNTGALLNTGHLVNHMGGLASAHYVGLTRRDGKHVFRLLLANRQQNQGTGFVGDEFSGREGSAGSGARRSSLRFISR
ncbi:MAG: PilC/PilY family type IV pilus protein [Proteobacteria bacterium]|nr:PilC/PilY family type IV pilus protein [Pseudomonadota bacterium]MCL2306891.1 PilC/PilY family type IV pilus protein [Pseudomonadota bacterium]